MRVLHSQLIPAFAIFLAISTGGPSTGLSSPRVCAELFKETDAEPRGPRSMAYHLEAPDAQKAYRNILLNLAENVSTKPILSIVIPAYMESARIGRSIEITRAFTERYPLTYEIIIVAERSADNTQAVATEAARGSSQIQVVSNVDGHGMQVQGGKGFAVKMGMMRATGQYRLFMDADLSTSMVEILRFLDIMTDRSALFQKPEVLIGSRAEHAGESEQQRTLMRQVMSSTMRGLTAMLGRPPDILDTQCGFKMFTENAGYMLFGLQQERGFAFDVELILLAKTFQYPVQSVPVEWIDAPGSTVRPIRDSIKMVKAMARIRAETGRVDRTVKRDQGIDVPTQNLETTGKKR